MEFEPTSSLISGLRHRRLEGGGMAGDFGHNLFTLKICSLRVLRLVLRLDGGWVLNVWDKFDIGSKMDISIIVIALLGLAIIFLWVALRL
jgi:hypothetical protein